MGAWIATRLDNDIVGPCSPLTACSYWGAIGKRQLSMWRWINIQHHFLSWNRMSDISALKDALNTQWNTKPIRSWINHKMSVTINCTSQVHDNNWSTSFHGMFQALHYQYPNTFTHDESKIRPQTLMYLYNMICSSHCWWNFTISSQKYSNCLPIPPLASFAQTS